MPKIFIIGLKTQSVLKVLVDNFGLGTISTVDDDIKQYIG